MVKYKCPVCDAPNYEGFITYPVCYRCHENLTQCQYCAYFSVHNPESPGHARCLHPRVSSQIIKDSIPTCSFRKSILAIEKKNHLSLQMSPGFSLAVLICTLFGLMVAAVSMLSELTPNPEMKMSFSGDCPVRVMAGDVITARFLIENQGESTEDNVRLRIQNSFFTKFRYLSMTPFPDNIESKGKSRYFVFKGLAPQKRLMVEMRLLALTPGKHELDIREARLYAASNKRFGVFRKNLTVFPASVDVAGKGKTATVSFRVL